MPQSNVRFFKARAPFLHTSHTVRGAMGQVVLCLCAVLLYAVFFYGVRLLISALFGALCCLVCELLIARLMRLPAPVGDLSFLVTALILVLLLPASAPLWLIAVGSLFATTLGKGVFGGLGHNPFNPAACALAFLTLCWPTRVFTYPTAPQTLPVLTEKLSAASYGSSVLSSLHLGGLPQYPFTEIFLGSVPAPAGAACFLVLLACLVFLSVRRLCKWQLSLSFLLTIAALAFLFPRAGSRVESVFLELFSGYLLFGAVFMLNDPSTSPRSRPAAVLYGIFCGAAVMLMRRFCSYEEGFCFALIICNALAPSFDRLVYFLRDWRCRTHGKRPANSKA